MALKLNTQASLWSNEMAGGQVANFSAYEGKIDAAILKEVQGVCRSPPLLPHPLRAAASCHLELLPSRRHGRIFCSPDSLRPPPAQIFETELKKAQADTKGTQEIEAVLKQWNAAFEGKDGLLELAAKQEKAAEAGLLQVVADMEKLELDVVGVADVTIGEILAREPELRAEIENEIKNNVWAP